MASKAQWFLMLRRAYKIPDGVSDDNARMIIARDFAEKHRGAATMLAVGSPDDLLRQLIEVVLTMFEASVFDRRLLPEDLQRHFDDRGGEWKEQLLSSLRELDNWPRPPNVPPLGEVVAVAEVVIQKITDYHIKHSDLLDITTL